jgi:hypothetical protein
VKPLRLHSAARLLTVVLLMVAWMVATNHCAFGMMKPAVAAGAAHSNCSRCPAPAKHVPREGTRECCQAIQGAPAQEKVGEKFERVQVVAMELLAVLQALTWPMPEPAVASSVFDHRPPRAASFAESVLQPSLLSHAPPFAV